MPPLKELSIFYISIHHINVLIITLAINVMIYVKAKKRQVALQLFIYARDYDVVDDFENS